MKFCWFAHAIAIQWQQQTKRQRKGPSVKQQSNQGVCSAHTVALGLSLTFDQADTNWLRQLVPSMLRIPVRLTLFLGLF
jgi:hypothetical protein